MSYQGTPSVPLFALSGCVNQKKYSHTGDSFWKLPRENTVVPLGARQNYCRRPFHSKYPNSPHQASTEGPSMHGVGIDRVFHHFPWANMELNSVQTPCPWCSRRTVKVQPSKTKTDNKKMASLRAFKFRHNTICFFPTALKKKLL